MRPEEKTLKTRGTIFKRTGGNILGLEPFSVELEVKTRSLKQQIADRDEKIQQIQELFEQLVGLVTKMQAEANNTERYQAMVEEHSEKLAQMEAELEEINAVYRRD